ncbi:hypothetical protein [Microscilla marina]|uniref:Uncharacterized protein n=1 Tax=Microscilla marina ATCC 23134 TaxID=313606 RepID=A1ZIU2_MICM2|nr:hypothetical protein [Microscilla marina]EAY29960.1 hypothetical protein M23134_05833 [Microscilla marina ATCC 23134]
MDENINAFINSIRRIMEALPADSKNLRGTVVEVDEAERTCEVQPLGGEAPLPDVRLVASIDSEVAGGVVFIPKIGSAVIVSMLEASESEAYVAKFGEVEKLLVQFSEDSVAELSEAGLSYKNGDLEVNMSQDAHQLKVGDLSLQLTADKLSLNGDSAGGLIKVTELKTEWNKNKAILDGLVQVLSGSPIPEPGNGSPSALQATLKGVVAGKQTGVFKPSFENKKVMHGDGDN